jgi:transcriptional regulator GlxA family with amidase domain
MRIGILLFNGADLLDCGGPYEVFLTANRLATRDTHPQPFEVVTIGVGPGPIAAYGGLGLIPQATIADADHLDVLIVPGTIDVDAALADENLGAAITTLAATADVTASVCTGAFLLGAHGLLQGRAWTTHWEDVDLLAERLGPDGATRDVRWVDSGDIVTSAGLSSGIAMALHLVDRFVGRDLAERTARQIEYDWDPEGVRSS